ncbi:MAG: succinate dehydrogenase cytochrome b subunit, partial [Bacteroidota bacterium]
GGEQFNIYAKFMTTNPVITFISYGNYFFILLHAFLGIYLWYVNRSAKGSRYAVKSTSTSSYSSRNMAWLGTIVLVFIIVHMGQFWFKMKFGELPLENYGTETDVKNLYLPVKEAFSNIGFVIFYVISMIIIAFHLYHGFQSGFQSLGLNHKKYTPIIRGLGKVIAIAVPLGFAVIPIAFYAKYAM